MSDEGVTAGIIRGHASHLGQRLPTPLDQHHAVDAMHAGDIDGRNVERLLVLCLVHAHLLASHAWHAYQQHAKPSQRGKVKRPQGVSA
jgi:hypothetical protein